MTLEVLCNLNGSVGSTEDALWPHSSAVCSTAACDGALQETKQRLSLQSSPAGCGVREGRLSTMLCTLMGAEVAEEPPQPRWPSHIPANVQKAQGFPEKRNVVRRFAARLPQTLQPSPRQPSCQNLTAGRQGKN